ncbi:MAG: hypothetical protein ACR2PO_09585 [Methyloligellaceae bacterium]
MRLTRFQWMTTLGWSLAAVFLVVGACAPSASAEFFAGGCRLIAFDSVYFEDGGRRRGTILTIGGRRPHANMNVVLEHKPGHNGNWTIEVVGCWNNFIRIPIPTPYYIDVPVRDLPGARRLKIVGANGVHRRRIPRR